MLFRAESATAFCKRSPSRGYPQEPVFVKLDEERLQHDAGATYVLIVAVATPPFRVIDRWGRKPLYLLGSFGDGSHARSTSAEENVLLNDWP